MTTAKQFVDSKIGEKKVVVFSKSWCGFCNKAKKYLKMHIPAEISEDDMIVEEIDSNPQCDAIQDYLSSITGARSVPRVFISGKCIGGGDETEAAHKSGQLAKMLKP